jgi:hypothetical protein
VVRIHSGALSLLSSVEERSPSKRGVAGSNPAGGTMARSTYIYLVMDQGAPVSAFTVKHEMMTWLSRNVGTYTIYRISDGIGFNKKPPVDVTADIV